MTFCGVRVPAVPMMNTTRNPQYSSSGGNTSTAGGGSMAAWSFCKTSTASQQQHQQHCRPATTQRRHSVSGIIYGNFCDHSVQILLGQFECLLKQIHSDVLSICFKPVLKNSSFTHFRFLADCPLT